MSAARIRAANSGVPANAIRIGVQPQLRSDISKPGAKQQLRLTATTAIYRQAAILERFLSFVLMRFCLS